MNIVLYVRFKFRCIPELFRCDGEKDCEFNEDEETCGESLGYKFQVLVPFSFTHIYWEQTSLFVSEYTLPLYTKEKNFALAKGGEEAYENIPLELVINLSSYSVRIVKIPISDFSEEILPYNMFFFSVCTILRTIHPIYLSLFPLFDREEGVLFILTEQREGDEQGKLLFCLWLLWTEVSDKYVIGI